ncbi:anti-repressor SinI family protein [Virgibacillus soli]|uniref:Anti-repressor SinI family protein n=1 Tax=Paracerasibacillus soli TaxID=480284 RepID=A0ABU5CRG3_9BACI|nr:anti-repressor SinI family protein [Virgibacillus soli]MDY0408939.1 anti-repressor SinI family protein [Virgibacillus soli]
MGKTIVKERLLDEEWVKLIKLAKFSGLTKDEIRFILQKLKNT